MRHFFLLQCFKTLEILPKLFLNSIKSIACYWRSFWMVRSPSWLFHAYGISMIILTAIIVKLQSENFGKEYRQKLENFKGSLFWSEFLHSSEWHSTKWGICNRSPAFPFFCWNNTNVTVSIISAGDWEECLQTLRFSLYKV